MSYKPAVVLSFYIDLVVGSLHVYISRKI